MLIPAASGIKDGLKTSAFRVSLVAMKTCLRWLALICLAATLGLWGVTGGNRGWTKTSLPVQKVDPVLEMEYTEWEKTFRPGIDFIIAGLLLSGVFLGVSALVGRRKPI